MCASRRAFSCARGEGGPFAQDQGLYFEGGKLPTNTNGGQLSEAFIHGVNNNLEAVRQIRRLPELGGIPIIATSASVAAADQALSREAGYDAFLPKPIAWPRLAALLQQYLELDWVYADEAEAAQVPAARR